ncbi:hypothetical protein T03_5212, partial [Trichinella britovi]
LNFQISNSNLRRRVLTKSTLRIFILNSAFLLFILFRGIAQRYANNDRHKGALSYEQRRKEKAKTRVIRRASRSRTTRNGSRTARSRTRKDK